MRNLLYSAIAIAIGLLFLSPSPSRAEPLSKLEWGSTLEEVERVLGVKLDVWDAKIQSYRSPKTIRIASVELQPWFIIKSNSGLTQTCLENSKTVAAGTPDAEPRDNVFKNVVDVFRSKYGVPKRDEKRVALWVEKRFMIGAEYRHTTLSPLVIDVIRVCYLPSGKDKI